MDPVTGAVVIVGLQKFGSPAADVVKNFLNKVLGPPGDALGQAAAHPILEWHRKRVDRAQELVENAARQLQAHGHEPQSVPSRVLMPLLESGSLEEDERLKQVWANLLARAASSKVLEVLPTYSAMLARLSPKEVGILTTLYQAATSQQYLQEDEFPFRTDTEDSDVDTHTARVYFGNFVALGIFRYGPATVSARSLREMADSLKNAEAAGPDSAGNRVVDQFMDLDIDLSTVHFTPLGLKFLEACCPLGDVTMESADEP